MIYQTTKDKIEELQKQYLVLSKENEELLKEIAIAEIPEMVYNNNDERYFLDNIAYFHAEFETIHPFCDGNGRIGRVLINYNS